MVKDNEMKRAAAAATSNEEATKEELQHRMERTREDLAETVEAIKETVEEQYASAKETVTGVLDFREHFKEEPLVWSLGALSAGFALGYTLGYAHKNMKTPGHKQSQVAAFADSISRELSTVGQSLVVPALGIKIKELFGFDFAELLKEMGGAEAGGAKKRAAKKAGTKKASKKSTAKTKKR
jgi:hypothetical protein